MDELTKLAIKYDTDKWGKHNYTPVYYEMFKDRRNEVKKVLEIGSAEGAGVRMFRDFFPKATIYGAEIDQKRVNVLQGEERIKVFKCDQSSREDLGQLLQQTGTDLDLVVDDGSHKPENQLFSCLTLMPFLNKNVTYVIEDVASVGTAIAIMTALEVNNHECKTMQVGKRYDDRLIIVRHKNG